MRNILNHCLPKAHVLENTCDAHNVAIERVLLLLWWKILWLLDLLKIQMPYIVLVLTMSNLPHNITLSYYSCYCIVSNGHIFFSWLRDATLFICAYLFYLVLFCLNRIPISVGLSICGATLNSINQFIQRKMVLTSDCITVSKAWVTGLFRMKYGNHMG